MIKCCPHCEKYPLITLHSDNFIHSYITKQCVYYTDISNNMYSSHLSLFSVFFSPVQSACKHGRKLIFVIQANSIQASKFVPHIDFVPGKVSPQCAPAQMPFSRFKVSKIKSRCVFVKFSDLSLSLFGSLVTSCE